MRTIVRWMARNAGRPPGRQNCGPARPADWPLDRLPTGTPIIITTVFDHGSSFCPCQSTLLHPRFPASTYERFSPPLIGTGSRLGVGVAAARAGLRRKVPEPETASNREEAVRTLRAAETSNSSISWRTGGFKSSGLYGPQTRSHAGRREPPPGKNMIV